MKTVALGDILIILNGYAFKADKFNSNREGIPVIRIRDVVRGYSETYFQGDYPPEFLIANGDLLIGMDGEFNIAEWQGGNALLNQRVCKITPKPGIADKSYLKYKLAEVLKQIELATPFVTVKHLSSEKLKKEIIELPPLEEQRRIAAILDQADVLRKARRRTIVRLNDLSQSIFYEMFGDAVTNNKNWPITTLESFGGIDRGVSKHRPRNAPELLGGIYPLIQTGDVSNSIDYIKTYQSTYSEIGLKQSKMWPKGTLCITIAANIANTAILDFDACFPDSVVGFSGRTEAITLFIHYWFKQVRSSIEAVAPAVAQKNINLQILRGLKVIFPPDEYIEEFANLVKSLSTVKPNYELHYERLDTLFSSLQQKAFRGELSERELVTV